MTIFASIPNTILIPLIICACVIAFFAVMDCIAWIHFKSKKNKAEKAAKAAEEAKNAPAASEATNPSTPASASANTSASTVIAASSVSSVNGGDNSANPVSNASANQPVNGTSNGSTVVVASSSQNTNSVTNGTVSDHQDVASSNDENGQASSTSSNAAFVGGVVAGAAATSAASSVSSESMSAAAEDGTVSASNSTNSNASTVGAAVATGSAAGVASGSSNGASDNGGSVVMAGGVSSNETTGVVAATAVAGAATSDDEVCTDNGGSSILAESTMNNQNGGVVMAGSMAESSSSNGVSSSHQSNGAATAYSAEAANVGAVYGVDGVAGHGGFLLFAFLGGDVNKDFYDYYVSPFGDKRRCLYHQDEDGSTRIVFDEALVEGEFFPSDYFEYFDEQEGGRSRIHMIDGVAGEKEDANFADPFASSYDVAAYNDQGQRVLTHYENGNEINEQVIADPDIAFLRDYTYKDGSLVSHLRHNRLAEQPLVNEPAKEEKPMKQDTIKEETPVAEEAAEQPVSEEEAKKAYERRASFAEKLAKADGLLRSRYAEINAEMEAYGIHSRLSVPCDTYSLHRQDYLKITIDGKSMKLCFHLSPKDYEKTTIPCEDASDKKTYIDTPLLLHITSGLSVRRALGLIADMMAKAGISKKEKK